MYDPVNDILLWSGKHDLWENNTLKVHAILTLWMVINYELFCSSGDIFENVDEVKANFLDCIRDKEKNYYNQLQIGVPSFETEDDDFLNSQAFLDWCEEPKLKKQKTT
ncbi:hypothetical protein FSP39_004728 [Pinctada imbricata]|uniref:Uncharacterized protein n=1 Tax=Pinctada imbricata TaxID=66713 RepID=A0AA89BIS0_PINIB|nr:hypothetical protein FSP39_004728 [Pinctada imbricata]